MISLEIFGPINIPCDTHGKKKIITKDYVEKFWMDKIAEQMAQKQGCYIFALRAGRGFTPWYIGKASKSFKQEVFTDHKINKYNGLLWEGKRGTPVMFFIGPPGTRKKVKRVELTDMEKYLIHAATLKNPENMNVQHTKNMPNWSIKGVVRGAPGKPSNSCTQFKSMMGL